jgi:hypothetical protein
MDVAVKLLCERRLMAFENRVLRKITGHWGGGGGEVIADWHNSKREAS